MIKIKIFLDPTLAALVLLRFVMGGLLCNICTKTKIMSKCLSRFILLFLKSLQKSTYLHYSSFMNQRKAYHTYKVFTFLFILGKMSFKTVSVLKNTFIISCHGKKNTEPRHIYNLLFDVRILTSFYKTKTLTKFYYVLFDTFQKEKKKKKLKLGR